MNTHHNAWEGVDVLIPKRVHQNRRAAIQAACMDVGALIGLLPGTPSLPQDAALADALAHADTGDCKAWIVRAIRALPTQAYMEANDGDA